MTTEQQFEYIGRYTVAKKDVQRLVAQRHALAGNLSVLLQRASLVNSSAVTVDRIYTLDAAAAEAKLKELIDINTQLEMAIDEMNRYADAAGESPAKRI
ncbi:hypothetical protein ACDA63_07125 [Uliginosibacterium sp. sgz301328]|uniref:hypothetical protein n=1 Tax=Uliginosibacterium sp. sgz301328 TaxID=3243764 RepID=UPI00359EBC38